MRPAPDTMTQLSALLPVKDGVAVWAVLPVKPTGPSRWGTSGPAARSWPTPGGARVLTPEERNRRAGAADDQRGGLRLGPARGRRRFGWVEHYGPVPGDLLREWIAANAEQASTSGSAASTSPPRPVNWSPWTRRRDGSRASWPTTCGCGTRPAAPVLRRTGPTPRPRQGPRRGGQTSADNGQGICECCNYTKAAHGWSARPRPGPRHTVETVTRPVTATPVRRRLVGRRARSAIMLDGFVLTS